MKPGLANMSMSVHYPRSGSPLRASALCLGAFALLYGGSFYTRDWRTAVPEGGHSVVPAPLARTAKIVEPLPRAAQPVARTEPDVTGALASRSDRAQHRSELPRPGLQRQRSARMQPLRQTPAVGTAPLCLASNVSQTQSSTLARVRLLRRPGRALAFQGRRDARGVARQFRAVDIARSRQRNVKHLSDAPRSRSHKHNPIAKAHGLAHVVGHGHDRFAAFLP